MCLQKKLKKSRIYNNKLQNETKKIVTYINIKIF